MQFDITGLSGYLSNASVYTISLKASVDQPLRILVPSSAKKQKPTDTEQTQLASVRSVQTPTGLTVHAPSYSLLSTCYPLC